MSSNTTKIVERLAELAAICIQVQSKPMPPDSMAQAITYSFEPVSRVLEAAQALTERLHFVHADHRYESVWFLAQLHSEPYAGPTYIDQQVALDKALADLQEVK